VYTARKVDTTALTAAGTRLSPAASDAARARAVNDEFGAVAPKFVELTNNVVCDDLWRRSDLSPRDRSLVTIAALAASGEDCASAPEPAAKTVVRVTAITIADWRNREAC
jgi:4-carboxymuconolactone decarboxylase